MNPCLPAHSLHRSCLKWLHYRTSQAGYMCLCWWWEPWPAGGHSDSHLPLWYREIFTWNVDLMTCHTVLNFYVHHFFSQTNRCEYIWLQRTIPQYSFNPMINSNWAVRPSKQLTKGQTHRRELPIQLCSILRHPEQRIQREVDKPVKPSLCTLRAGQSGWALYHCLSRVLVQSSRV